MKSAATLSKSSKGTPALSAGWRPSFSVSRPSLAINDVELDQAPEVSIGEKYASRVLATIAILFTVLSVVFVGVWAMLVSTISATPRIDNNILLVQRAAWVEGEADIGQIAFAVPGAETSAGSRLVEAISGYQGGMVVEIAAQPGQARSIGANGNLIVEKFDLGVKAPSVLPGTDADYLAVCVAGSCPKATIIALPVSDVVGKVSGVLGSDGFRDFTRGN